jgi:hypothetical protein
VNLELLRQDAIDLLTSRQWTGGPDAQYYALRERTTLQVDVVMEVVRLHVEGVSCACPAGSEKPHRRTMECLSSAAPGRS